MPKTVTGKKDLSTLATASVTAAQKMQAINLAYKPEAERILHQFDAALEAMPPSARAAAKPGFDQKIAEQLKALRSQTEAARKQIIADLKEAKALSDEFAPHFGNARIVASMWKIGDAAKERFRNELADAGPATVKSAAVQAKLMMNDPETAEAGRMLASVVIARNQSFEPRNRPIADIESYAAEVFATEIADVSNYATGISISLAQAEAAEREILGTGTSPLQRVKLGLTFPNERVSLGEVADDGSVEPTPNDKIRSGLASIKSGLAAMNAT